MSSPAGLATVLAGRRPLDADRALLRRTKGEGLCPRGCLTCQVLTERTQENDQ
ncbi:MAG: hypothetical protein HOY79_06040 [Streptomyces sp.]|jgi:hypothetical protein|nr:hypothetical protein [Streptomyces sp.]